METRCGSPHYLPPEIVLGQKYGPKVDIWSLGVLLYVSLTGRFPFSGSNVEEIYDAIVSLEPEFPSSMSRGMRGPREAWRRVRC